MMLLPQEALEQGGWKAESEREKEMVRVGDRRCRVTELEG